MSLESCVFQEGSQLFLCFPFPMPLLTVIISRLLLRHLHRSKIAFLSLSLPGLRKKVRYEIKMFIYADLPLQMEQ